MDAGAWTGGLPFGLLGAAALVAVVHTAVGVDHYVPIVALSRASGWTRRRTLATTFACGVAHVVSCLVLGAVLIGVGAEGEGVALLDGVRGAVLAWGLVVFGVAYALWPRAGGHGHGHGPAGGQAHGHAQAHAVGRGRGHGRGQGGWAAPGAATWSLYVLFVLGPCEPLAPFVFLPALRGEWALAASTAFVFSFATVATMLVLVALADTGVRRFASGSLERLTNALVGAAVAASGAWVLLGF